MKSKTPAVVSYSRKSKFTGKRETIGNQGGFAGLVFWLHTHLSDVYSTLGQSGKAQKAGGKMII